MTWRDQLTGSDGASIGRAATRAREAALVPAAVVSGAVRAAAGVRSFEWNGRTLPYLVHPYNETWRNERAIEVPIARDWLEQRPTGPILEVGHVLGHYGCDRGQTVIDLYEPAAGVINVDAIDYAPSERFTSIVSVSTLEHVGYDEEDLDPDKTRRVVDHLASLLAPAGEMLLTFPLGYHHALDEHLRAGRLGFDEVTVMRRLTTLGAWEQTDLSILPRARYGFPFGHGNVIAVGVRSTAE